MIKLLVEKLPRITKNRKKLERELSVKITNRGKEVYLDGKPEDEFVAEKVIQALDFGFPFAEALDLLEPDATFERINLKDHTTRKDLTSIRARIIGTKGKTLATLSSLTRCNLELHDNAIGIIGDAEHMQTATTAIISLIQGSKQGNVYAYLEKHQPKEIFDLGLKKKNL